MLHPIPFYGSAVILGLAIPYFLIFPAAIIIAVIVWSLTLYLWNTTKDKELGSIIGMIAVSWAVIFSIAFALVSLIFLTFLSISVYGIDFSGLLR